MAKAEKAEKVKREIAKDLAALKKGICKTHGDGAVMQGRNQIVRVESFPTGIISLDRALGCGGLPMGRIIEFFGMESSGKTTTCLHLIAAAQTHYFDTKGRQGVAAFVDAEHAFDPTWAEKLGVDVDNLLISQPNSGEEALDIVERMAESGLVDLIVVDSVANLVPQSELDGEMGGSSIGAQARLLSQAMRKLSGKASKTKTTIIFINQIRQKIGIMFGSPDVTTGGLALKFYSSIRMQILKGSAIKVKEETVAFSPTVKVIKNKVAPPFTEAEYAICFGHPERPVYGIDMVASLLDEGVDLKVIELNGSHYSFEGEKLGNGLANAAKYLRENQKAYVAAREKIYNTLRERVQVTNSGGGEDELADSILDEDADE
jgi:recombination protein RecA